MSSENFTTESTYKWSWFAQNHYEEGIIIRENGIDYLEFSFAGNCKVQVQLSKEGNQTPDLASCAPAFFQQAYCAIARQYLRLTGLNESVHQISLPSKKSLYQALRLQKIFRRRCP